MCPTVTLSITHVTNRNSTIYKYAGFCDLEDSNTYSYIDGNTDHCLWSPVTSCTADAAITGIRIRDEFGREGDVGTGSTIPELIGALAQLESLKLEITYRNWCHKVEGEIPTKIGLLANLKVLDLGYNSMFGAIPSELTKLTTLDTLDLLRNSLSYQGTYRARLATSTPSEG